MRLPKKINGINAIISLCFVVWVFFFITVIFKIDSKPLIDNINYIFHFFIFLPLIFYTFKVYSYTEKTDKKIIIYFFVSIICTTLNFSLFHLVISMLRQSNSSISAITLARISNITISFLWEASSIGFLFIILKKNIFEHKTLFKILPFFLIANAIILFLCLNSADYNIDIPSSRLILKISFFILEFILFDLVLLCLLHTKNTGFLLVLYGFIIHITGDFIVDYSYPYHLNASLFPYGLSMSFLGIIIILWGILTLHKMQDYNIANWLRPANTVKSKLAFWVFSLSMSAFLLFFVICYIFPIMNREVFLALPIFMMVYSIVTVFFSVFIGGKFEVLFKKLERNIDILFLSKDKAAMDTVFSIQEFSFLQRYISDTVDLREKRDEAVKKAGKIAAQVAHDIRSPLTAMNTMLQELPQLPEDKRIILRNVAARINDIANNLLVQYKGEEVAEKTLAPHLIAPLIDSILSEKRLQLPAAITLEADIDKAAYFVFANINLPELKRVLSNLINNACEAFADKAGKIIVALSLEKENIVIKIIDNGCGIPEEKLATIFTAQTTTKKQGSGIGLFHAKEAIEAMQGTIAIHSSVGSGTTVSIALPIETAPAWFLSTLILYSEETIVILDDDESIHGAWESRLREVAPTATILHFRKGQEFESWYQAHKAQPIKVLSDYELLGELKTGLDLLESLAVKSRGVLITSHYERQDIIERCAAEGIKLLPKSLVTYLPIRVEEHHQPPRPPSASTPPLEGNLKVDYILIDDDALMHQMWTMYGKNLQMALFKSAEEAEASIMAYDTSTPIYIDSTLGNGVKGEDYAKTLYERGFHELYLATGYDPDHFSPMPWIKKIVGKRPPFLNQNGE
jgi:signal transduction histidine kinase